MGFRQKLRNSSSLQISVQILSSHCFGPNSSHRIWGTKDPGSLMYLSFGIVWILLIVVVQRQLVSLSLENETNRYSGVVGRSTAFVLHLNTDQSPISVVCRHTLGSLLFALWVLQFLRGWEKKKAHSYRLSLKAANIYKFYLLWKGCMRCSLWLNPA